MLRLLHWMNDPISETGVARRHADTRPVATPLRRYAATPPRRYAATPLRRYAATPLRRYAATPLRRYAATPTRSLPITRKGNTQIFRYRSSCGTERHDDNDDK
jgi:hypothetical protein